jgi:hypothetical protein
LLVPAAERKETCTAGAAVGYNKATEPPHVYVKQLPFFTTPVPCTHLLAVIQAERELAVEHAEHVQALGSIQLQQQLRLAKRGVDSQHIDGELSLVEQVAAGSRAAKNKRRDKTAAQHRRSAVAVQQYS